MAARVDGPVGNTRSSIENQCMQRPIILFFIFLLGLFPLSAEPIMVEYIRAERVDDERIRCWTKVEVANPYSGQVFIPLEGLFIAADSAYEILENNVLGTGLALDLNGDGDTEDIYPLKGDSGRLSIGPLTVEPFQDEEGNQKTKDASVSRLSESGPGLFLYQGDKSKIVAGIDFSGQKAEFKPAPNPNFQFLLLEPCDGPGSKPSVELLNRTALTLVHEPGMFDTPWMFAQTLILPIDSPLECTLRGTGPAVILGRVNFDRGDGIRRKTKSLVTPVNWEAK